MAAFQFPDPALQTTVTNPITGSTYQWKEPPGKWVVTVKMRDVGDIIWEGDNPPDPIGDYKLWYSTDTLELYFYYCDAAGTCAWVPTSVPIQVLEDLNAFAAQAEVDIDQLQYKQQLLQNALDQLYLDNQLDATDQDLDDLRTQVNGNSYTNNQQSQAIVNLEQLIVQNFEEHEEIKNDIIELEEEIDAIAPSVERGTWRMTLSGSTSSRGLLTMYDDTFGQGSPIGIFAQVKSIWFHEEDIAGTPHGFNNVDPGHLIELFVEGEPDYGLFEVVEVHDQTVGSPNPYYAIDVNFVRALSNTAKADPNDLVRMKTFQAPSGGTADGFVLKSGDQMTGELEFYKEQADLVANYDVPVEGTKDIRFSTKNTNGGSTSTIHLYQPGYSNVLTTSGSFLARGNIYTTDFFYATYFLSNGTRATKLPRIYLNRTADSSGNVTSEYGALRWSGDDRVYWDEEEVQINKTPLVLDGSLATEDTHAIHKGYVDKVIRMAGLQLGMFQYIRSSDGFAAGCIKSNTSTNPANITQLDIWKSNINGIFHGVDFYEDIIVPGMYLHFADKGSSNYAGKITAVERLTNGIRLKLNPIPGDIIGSVYLRNQYDVTISYNRFGFKFP